MFTTALVHHLTRNTQLPAFRASAEGRIRQAHLAHQPDDDVPRFTYEDHAAALIRDRRWPQSTNRISQLRVDIDFERRAGWRPGPATLALDIVDYPGEWLLDLALLDASYEEWSRQTVEASRRPDRAAMAAPWHENLKALDPQVRPTKWRPRAQARLSKPIWPLSGPAPRPSPPRRRAGFSCRETLPGRRH